MLIGPNMFSLGCTVHGWSITHGHIGRISSRGVVLYGTFSKGLFLH